MGGVVSDILFKNITGYEAEIAASVTMCHHNWAKGTLPTPIWRNTSFEDIYLKVRSLGTFQGLPESPIQGLHFRNVTFHGVKPDTAWECKCYGKLYASGTADG